MQTVLTVTLPFFAVVGCGYLAGRLGMFGPAAVRSLNGFVFYFALPALLIRALANRPLAEIADLSFMAVYAAGGLLLFAASALLGRLIFDEGLSAAGIRGQAASVGNIGFLGLPMMIALFGAAGAVPIVLALIVDLLLILPLAILFLEAGRGEGGWLQRIVLAFKGVAVNPIFLSILVGVVLSASGVGMIVAPVDSFAEFIGAAAGPCALFALGASLVGSRIASGYGEVAFLTMAKLVAHPLLIWFLMGPIFNLDPAMVVAGTLIAALPIAGNVFIFAERYQVNVARASTAILISTLFAVASFSLAVAFLGP